jgi:hypothetical protein
VASGIVCISFSMLYYGSWAIAIGLFLAYITKDSKRRAKQDT